MKTKRKTSIERTGRRVEQTGSAPVAQTVMWEAMSSLPPSRLRKDLARAAGLLERGREWLDRPRGRARARADVERAFEMVVRCLQIGSPSDGPDYNVNRILGLPSDVIAKLPPLKTVSILNALVRVCPLLLRVIDLEAESGFDRKTVLAIRGELIRIGYIATAGKSKLAGLTEAGLAFANQIGRRAKLRKTGHS